MVNIELTNGRMLFSFVLIAITGVLWASYERFIHKGRKKFKLDSYWEAFFTAFIFGVIDWMVETNFLNMFTNPSIIVLITFILPASYLAIYLNGVKKVERIKILIIIVIIGVIGLIVGHTTANTIWRSLNES
jgi:hypothetical protein